MLSNFTDKLHIQYRFCDADNIDDHDDDDNDYDDEADYDDDDDDDDQKLMTTFLLGLYIYICKFNHAEFIAYVSSPY